MVVGITADARGVATASPGVLYWRLPLGPMAFGGHVLNVVLRRVCAERGHPARQTAGAILPLAISWRSGRRWPRRTLVYRLEPACTARSKARSTWLASMIRPSATSA